MMVDLCGVWVVLIAKEPLDEHTVDVVLLHPLEVGVNDTGTEGTVQFEGRSVGSR